MCIIKAFGFATNQHYFGATGESLLRGKLERRAEEPIENI
jgi:hypothetical protein